MCDILYTDREQHNKEATKRKGEIKMTMIIFCIGFIACGIYEAVTDYYGFNLESEIRKMQDKSKFFA